MAPLESSMTPSIFKAFDWSQFSGPGTENIPGFSRYGERLPVPSPA